MFHSPCRHHGYRPILRRQAEAKRSGKAHGHLGEIENSELKGNSDSDEPIAAKVELFSWGEEVCAKPPQGSGSVMSPASFQHSGNSEKDATVSRPPSPVAYRDVEPAHSRKADVLRRRIRNQELRVTPGAEERIRKNEFYQAGGGCSSRHQKRRDYPEEETSATSSRHRGENEIADADESADDVEIAAGDPSRPLYREWGGGGGDIKFSSPKSNSLLRKRSFAHWPIRALKQLVQSVLINRAHSF